jgi:hypothetical protein
MDETDQLYIQLIKQEMIDALESGILKPEQQYAMVDSVVQRLLRLKDENIVNVVKQYIDDQGTLKTKITTLQKDMEKTMDEYAENVKNMYEQIKKL